MNVQDGSFKKISGSKRVDGLKLNLIKKNVTKHDLEIVIKTTAYIINNLNSKIESLIIESMTCLSIVAYARCFGSSGLGYAISKSIYDHDLEKIEHDQIIGQANVTEREFHDSIMNYRNKHIAHSDDFLKSFDVGGCYDGDNNIGLGPVCAFRTLTENREFYRNLQKLANKALNHIQIKMNIDTQEIIKSIQNKECVITNDNIQLMPVKSDALKMWGIRR